MMRNWGNLIKIVGLIVGIYFFVFLLFFFRLEQSYIPIGEFSFSFLHDKNEENLTKAIQYLESYEINTKKNKLVFEALNRLYFKENVTKPLGKRIFDGIVAFLNHASQKQLLRRVFASFYAKKMGLLAAAETEIRTNLYEKKNCTDLIFLGQILSLKTPVDNEEVLKQFRKALSLPDCKRDSANYEMALINIHLQEGHILFNKNKFNEAAQHYLEVTESDPRSFAGYYSLANSFANSGRFQEAVNYYDRAIMYSISNDNSSLARFFKAKVLYSLSETSYRLDPNKRTATLKEAMNSADLAVRLVEIEYGNFQSGSFQKQLLAEEFLLRGKLHYFLGDPERARNDFNSCFKNTLDPSVRNECEKRLTEM